MANVPYNVNDVIAPTGAPDDYQRIETSPDMFGGAIGQAEQGFGKEAQQASQTFQNVSEFYGQASADQATNGYQDIVTKILHGDPNKMVPGPDGKPTQDTGYFGLEGAAALNARPNIEKQIEDARNTYRTGLTSPQSQLQFDNYTRRYGSYVAGQMGSFADSQAKQWANSVNQDTASLAINQIGANANDPNQVQAGTDALINARVKDAQLHGAQVGDPVYNAAVDSGKRDALKAQVQAIGVADPARAMSILDKNRDIAGVDYAPLAKTFKEATDAREGINFGGNVLAAAHQSVSSQGGERNELLDALAKGESGGDYNKVFANGKFGAPSKPVTQLTLNEAIETARQIRGNPNNPNNAGPLGKYQFVGSTLEGLKNQLHLTGNEQFNPALQDRLAWANALNTGGDPNKLRQQWTSWAGKSDAEIKQLWENGLQQHQAFVAGGGAPSDTVLGPSGGPAAATAHPQIALAPSEDASAQPIFEPGGSYEQTASSSPGTGGIGTAAPVAPTGETPPPQVSGGDYYPLVKADAYQRILQAEQAGTLSTEAAAHAFQFVNQTLQIQQIAEAEQEKAKNQANDKAANGYVSQILTGQGGADMVQRIASDPALKWETRKALGDAVVKASKGDVAEQAQTYGPGFWSAYKAITAPVGDPSRISDVTSVLRRAGPGGDLTLAGVEKLSTIMGQNQRSVGDQAVNTTKVGLMSYAKSQLSFDQETSSIPGMPPIRDPKGEAIFQAQFIPKFEASYDQWVKEGKDPWQFLTKENTDKLINGMRPKSQMAMDQVAATADANGGVMPTQAPPAPKGANPQAWNAFMLSPPKTVDGKTFPPQAWAGAINLLLSNPTPENIQKWDASKFGQGGYLAEDILSQLRGGTTPSASATTVAAPAAAKTPTIDPHLLPAPKAADMADRDTLLKYLGSQPAEAAPAAAPAVAPIEHLGLQPSAGHALPPQAPQPSPFSPHRTGR